MDVAEKDRILICGLVYIFLISQSLSVIYAGQPPLPGDFNVSENFSFFGSGGIDWQALNDPNNNPILVACMEGKADDSLKPLGIYDVKQRLERLQRGNLIKKVGDRYVLAFPAVVGDKRDRLQTYAEQAARQLMPFSEKMIAQIRPNLAGRDEMLYHVLWSVVMDGGPAWDAARAEMNRKIRDGDTSTENKAWLLYPPHRSRVGTNSYNTPHGHLKITWSPNTPGPNVVGGIVSKYLNRMAQAVERNTKIESAGIKEALGRYGLVDGVGKVRLYTILSDSDAARVYLKLGTEFGRQMMANLDVEKVAGMLDVSPGIAFVIAYHEICWQLLQDLAEKKVLQVPSIVTKSPLDSTDAYQLVSLTAIKSVADPLLDTEMSAEEAKAIEEYRRIREKILAGDKYQDSSTPLGAVLTHLSELEQGQTRDYFMGFNIFRAPLPPAEPEEASLWPVYAGDKELADTFILVYSQGKWIWIDNMGSNYNWRLARSSFDKWAREKIGQSVPAKPSATETEAPSESTDNRVLSLDGKTGCMLVADSQSLRSFSDAITIEVLVKASSFYPDDWAISSIVRKNVAEGAENFLLRFRNIDGGLCVQMGLGDLGTLGAPYEFAINKWYHIAGTYDGQRVTAFVNGQPIASQNISGRLYIDISDLYIGKGDPEYLHSEYLHGELDEIRIWNVVRSQEQILATINTSLSGREGGLVAYWNFDDGTAADLSGHGNDGQLNQGAGIVQSSRPAISAPAQELPGELLAWWKLDEANGNDVADSSPNGYGGRLVGNPQWRPAGGKVGGALEFDGDGDWVQIDDESAFDIAGAITVAAWIKVNTFDTRWQTIIAKGDTSWRLQRTADANTVAFHCTGIKSVGSQWGNGIEGKKSVNDEQWHHVVGVYDGARVSLYIDGVLDNSGEASGNIRTNDIAVTIGENSEQGDRQWNGLIDEPCVIAGAIDAAGAQALYTGADPIVIAKTAKQLLQDGDKLLAWWKFDNDANDSAGTNHGTIHGNPTYAEGKVGRAISFDGDDYVDCGNPDSLNFGTGDWTISAWIKTTQSGMEPVNRGTVFANGGDETGGIRYTLAVNEEYLGTVVLTTDNDTYKIQAFGKTTVNNGDWHQVVGMRNAGQLRVYVDGALDGNASLPPGYDLSGVSQHNAYIGAITDHRDNSLFKYFVGLIDEICIFSSAINANGIRSLYAGEDPAKVAQTSIIAGVAPQPPPRQVSGVPGEGIEGDWQVVSSQSIIEIRRKPDGALGATIVAQSSDVAAPAIPLDEVTFENGIFRFKMISNQGDFEGTMKEDGSSIEGQFRQQEQTIAVTLTRIKPVPSVTAPASPQQLRGQTSGRGNIATVLILVIALAGVVGGIVFFLVKSSIR